MQLHIRQNMIVVKESQLPVVPVQIQQLLPQQAPLLHQTDEVRTPDLRGAAVALVQVEAGADKPDLPVTFVQESLTVVVVFFAALRVLTATGRDATALTV